MDLHHTWHEAVNSSSCAKATSSFYYFLLAGLSRDPSRLPAVFLAINQTVVATFNVFDAAATAIFPGVALTVLITTVIVMAVAIVGTAAAATTFAATAVVRIVLTAVVASHVDVVVFVFTINPDATNDAATSILTNYTVLAVTTIDIFVAAVAVSILVASVIILVTPLVGCPVDLGL
uniref:Uncharacterized protein n=1 Tax=Anopheles atroparvus TaxID=41427 RepID=A0A182IPU6_ANOAO